MDNKAILKLLALTLVASSMRVLSAILTADISIFAANAVETIRPRQLTHSTIQILILDRRQGPIQT